MKNYADFRKAILDNKDLAKKFAECKTPEALVEAAAKEGYAFTVEDIKNNTELLPGELEKSAGSGWFVTPSTIVRG